MKIIAVFSNDGELTTYILYSIKLAIIAFIICVIRHNALRSLRKFSLVSGYNKLIGVDENLVITET